MNSSKWKLDNLVFDSETANKVFVEKFKVEFKYDANDKILYAGIKNFCSKENLKSLWKQCKYDENYSCISMIPEIVDTVLKYEDAKIFQWNNRNEYIVVKDIVGAVEQLRCKQQQN